MRRSNRRARVLSSAPWFRSSRRLEAFQLAADLPPTPSKSSLTAGETRHLNLPGPFKNRVRHLRDALPPSGRTSGTRRTRSAARTMPQGTGSEALARLVAAVAKGQKTVPQVLTSAPAPLHSQPLEAAKRPASSLAAMVVSAFVLCLVLFSRSATAAATGADAHPLLLVVWLWGVVCLFVCLFLRPPTRCPVHHIPHIFLVSAFSACLSPHAPCTMACRSRRRPLSSIVVGCLPVVCRRWPSPPSFPRIYRPIAPDRAGNDAGAGRRVCCHAWCRQRMPLAAFAVAVLAKLLL